jgi:AspT/YidE/YbjL antiporter-like protein
LVKQGASKTVTEISQRFDRASIERILRENAVVEVKPDVVLKAGDVVAVTGRLASVLAAGDLIGQEVEDKEALSFSIEVANVVVTNKHIVGKTLGEIREDMGIKDVEAVYLVSLKRQGLAIPILLNTVVQRGDVAQLAGRPGEVQKAADLIGRSEPAGAKSDLAYHALGIVIGILVGLITISVGGIPVTLGIGGGVLVVGLCFGWLHARYPVFGTLPQAAQAILSEFGLSAFAAIIGLTAGPKALAAIQQQGLILLVAGAALTLVPIVATLYFGRFILKLHPVVLLGALSGGQTVAASLNAVNEATDSMTPVLGFTVAYAISNVLLAVWGPLIVAIVK